MASRSSGSHAALSPTNTATLMAMQRCPAAPQDAATKLSTTASLLASGITTMWFFAPAIACTRFRCRVPSR